ncbi:hypothetical protein KC333_g5876 [Hortaea werneckii]|nr:hypothetical protein KC333_g5876 [Hortaea werneckii]KAI7312637.1 hypothetical protein KC326_g5832 [Hortaea werneckii]
MRASPLLLTLPAIAAAQQQIPFLDNVKSWFNQATASVSSAIPSPPSPSDIPDPIASGAAAIADLKLQPLTLENHKEILKPGAATASPGIEEWMVYVTGGNKTCMGRCQRADKAFNESIPLLAASTSPPNLATVNCEAQGVLCHAWALAPPQVLQLLLPQPLPDQDTPATTMRAKNLNRTTVAATEIASLHLQEKWNDVPVYEGYWHPFDGPLAQFGVNIPIGYVIYYFSQVPSWAFMIGISFFSRTFMSRRMQPQAPQGGARAAAPRQ